VEALPQSSRGDLGLSQSLQQSLQLACRVLQLQQQPAAALSSSSSSSSSRLHGRWGQQGQQRLCRARTQEATAAPHRACPALQQQQHAPPGPCTALLSHCNDSVHGLSHRVQLAH
jgi:hypothetical protein